MYSPENEESHRPTALSDCIPGFLLVHIVCIQRQIVDRRPDRALAYATELMRLYPFGANCIDNSGWPISAMQVIRYYRRLRRAFAAGPPEGEPWPVELLREMAWHVDSAKNSPDDKEPNVGEEAEVCPFGTLPDCGVCWVLGDRGESCRAACSTSGLSFRRPRPDGWPEMPLVPRILDLSSEVPKGLSVQFGWKAFECYVPEEGRFHLATPAEPMSEDWSYPICALACPCGPEIPAELDEVLRSVPSLPDP